MYTGDEAGLPLVESQAAAAAEARRSPARRRPRDREKPGALRPAAAPAVASAGETERTRSPQLSRSNSTRSLHVGTAAFAAEPDETPPSSATETDLAAHAAPIAVESGAVSRSSGAAARLQNLSLSCGILRGQQLAGTVSPRTDHPPRPVSNVKAAFPLTRSLSDGLDDPGAGMTAEARHDKREPLLAQLSQGSFWKYALCFCVANFDLDLGPSIEVVYPPLALSDAERHSVAFSAFPDSNSNSNLGDAVFSFRIPTRAWAQAIYGGQRPAIGQSAFSNVAPIETDGFTYGFCYFVQTRDAKVRRGFLQKTVVLLTPHPWPGLWTALVERVGRAVVAGFLQDREQFGRVAPALLTPPGAGGVDLGSHSHLSSSSSSQPAATSAERAFSEYINHDASATVAALRRACRAISRWPAPPCPFEPVSVFCNRTLNLPAPGGVDLCLAVPPTRYFAQLLPTSSEEPLAANPVRLHAVFGECLDELWQLWEHVLLCESVLVVGQTPGAVSEVVWSLVELVKPIPYGGDWRPYFTVQDPDFKRLAGDRGVSAHGAFGGSTGSSGGLGSAQKATAGRILGVTNALFTRAAAAAKWGAVVHVDATGEIPRVERVHRQRKSSFFSVDKDAQRSVADAAARGASAAVLNNMLRRHFTELTERFVQPLNRYFEQVLCNRTAFPTSLVGVQPQLAISPFRDSDFLRSIEDSPPSLSQAVRIGRELVEFYRRFLRTPNFAMWLGARTDAACREYQRHYIELLASADVEAWRKEKSQVEVIDLLLLYRQLVLSTWPHHGVPRQCDSDLQPPVPGPHFVLASREQAQRLRAQMRVLYLDLPDELQRAFIC